MTDDQQVTAESLDPDELGDDPAGDEYPPTEPQGVSDPTQDDRFVDSVRDRDAREEPESASDGPPGLRLFAPNEIDDDDVAELTAGSIEAEDLSAEEAAIHVETVRRTPGR